MWFKKKYQIRQAERARYELSRLLGAPYVAVGIHPPFLDTYSWEQIISEVARLTKKEKHETN